MKEQRKTSILAVAIVLLALVVVVTYQAFVIEKQRYELQRIVASPCGFKFKL